MLKDLSLLISECQDKWNELPNKLEIKLSPSFKDLFKKYAMQYYGKNGEIYINDYSIIYTNIDGQRAAFPMTWFYYAYAYAPLLKELEKYINKFNEIINKIYKDKKLNRTDKNSFLKKLPCKNWKELPEAIPWVHEIEKELENLDDNDKNYMNNFISAPDWWIKSTTLSSGRKLDRNDVVQSSLNLAMNVILASSDKLYDIVKICSCSEVRIALKNLIDRNKNSVGQNIIFYGAPGTGKSYLIEELTRGSNCIHTVFHADTQNVDFLGMLKPIMDDNGSCGYRFMPGPFIQSYINALKNPAVHHYLIIEEINRAQAAMVFGEIFQLLDRDENGVSCYKIEPVDQSLVDYLRDKLDIKSDNNVELQIPGNLSILATMNSSDQAVMPLDTAFRRRWEFEYVEIDMKKASKTKIKIPSNQNIIEVSWQKLAIEINRRLSENNIPEDRHLGPFFLSQNEINEKGLTNKLFIYLWDDLLRHQSKTIIFNSEIKTFGQLISYFRSKQEIFCPELIEKLLAQ